ncbi:MAG: BrnT family toxin [Candidatus Omnitrophica bacterium]|nr:BrnT family toxin [Candidatus Omnitrophota bacterium]
MKYYTWDNKKNEKLITELNISFEEIVFYIEKGCLLDILKHPNKKKYEGQYIFVIRVEDYVYLVPFVENEREIFLKTIIPSRKATRKYLKGGGNDGQNE